MEDQGILELFFARSEQAIAETDRKYGGYCYSIAYNILSSKEDSEESVSDTYLAALISPDTGIFHDRIAVEYHHQAKGELKAKKHL